MNKNPYACAECDGTGAVECCECGSDVDCDACGGTGLDDTKINVKAFAKAKAELMVKGGGVWGWRENGVMLGYQTKTTKLAFKDFQLCSPALPPADPGFDAVAGSKVFVGDMTDVFGEWVSDELLDRLFAVFALRSDITWQVLTKRAERMHRYFADLPFRVEQIGISAESAGGLDRYQGQFLDPRWPLPLPNVWLGVSVEDQQRADERIPHLLKTPAAVRFLSVEPLLGPVDLTRVRHSLGAESFETASVLKGDDGFGLNAPRNRIDWVIVGGESGPGARPFDLDWAVAILKQCRAADVPAFVKQVGSNPVFCGHSARGITTSVWGPIKDKKGGLMEEWPLDLRVREFPITKGV